LVHRRKSVGDDEAGENNLGCFDFTVDGSNMHFSQQRSRSAKKRKRTMVSAPPPCLELVRVNIHGFEYKSIGSSLIISMSFRKFSIGSDEEEEDDGEEEDEGEEDDEDDEEDDDEEKPKKSRKKDDDDDEEEDEEEEEIDEDELEALKQDAGEMPKGKRARPGQTAKYEFKDGDDDDD
jgi:flagellar biosynthesis/type III secretory pathway M-ring protein FliF/YscJ